MKKVFLSTGVVLAGVYLIILAAEVLTTGKSYGCDKVPKYRIDYVFPARQISCYLYEEVK